MDGLESTVRQLVTRYDVTLLAEEGLEGFPLTTAQQVARERSIRYLQVDMDGNAQKAAGIKQEIDARSYALLDKYGADERRFPRADDIRENFWLDKIEKAGNRSVLVVCGWAHARALARKLRERCGNTPEVIFFPEQLKRSTIVELSLDGQGAVQAYSHCRI